MSVELILAILALVTSVLSATASVWLYNRELALVSENHLSDLWHNILDISRDNPRYLDANITEGYKRHMTHDERVRYDIYCQKAWGHVHEIVVRNLHKEARFRAAIQWLVTFHYEWLRDNPAFFQSVEFWKAVEQGKNEPAVILRHRPMPTLENGEIDWNTVAPEYHSYVLSPYNPEMLTSPDGAEGRNLLVNDLRQRIRNSPSDIVEIADFGCGTGNLLAALEGLPVRIVGVDISEDSLGVAKDLAADIGIEFDPVVGNLADPSFDLGRRFDIIVSSNSVLPSDRPDVVEILRTMRRHLSRNGSLFAILPSFDTTEYLNGLWREQFLRSSKSELHADRVSTALRKSKLSDEKTLSYADDGHTSQCYHTPESIADEFEQAGLVPATDLRKVYYPWELTRRFDYGWFPDAPEEIWDWYIVARSAVEQGELADPGQHHPADDVKVRPVNDLDLV